VPGLRRVGHKGADLIAPGNTFASFDAAVDAGVHMIEFDVLPEHHDGTGELWLAHDYEAAKRIEPRPHTLAERYNGQPKDLLFQIYVKYLPMRTVG